MLKVVFLSSFLSLSLINEVIFAKNKNSLFLSNLILKNNQINHIDNTKLKLSINNIENIFKKNNKELRILKSQISQSESLLKSKFSLWYPKINLNSTSLPSLETGAKETELSNNSYTKKLTTSINFNLEWDLINFSRNPEINIAKLNLESSKLNYKIKYRELFLETLSNFLLFKSSNKEIKVAEKAIAISEISLNDAKDKFAAGIGNKLEVLEAETQLAKDRQFLANAIGDAKKQKKALLRSLSLKSQDIILEKEKFYISGIWNVPIKKSISDAKENREELKNIKLNQIINRNQGYVTSSGKKPKLSIYNTYSISSLKGEEDKSTPDYSKYENSENNIVGMKFNWALFDGGSTKENFKSIKEKGKELEIEYKVYSESIENDIENNFVDLNLSAKNILTSYEQIKSSEEALKLSMQRFKAGVTNQREVLINLKDFTESKSRFIKAISEYNINLEKLKMNTGISKTLTCSNINSNNNEFVSNEVYKDIDLNIFEKICSEDILKIL